MCFCCILSLVALHSLTWCSLLSHLQLFTLTYCSFIYHILTENWGATTKRVESCKWESKEHQVREWRATSQSRQKSPQKAVPLSIWWQVLKKIAPFIWIYVEHFEAQFICMINVLFKEEPIRFYKLCFIKRFHCSDYWNGSHH